jgi:ATP-dependent helicase STH1/SNF2
MTEKLFASRRAILRGVVNHSSDFLKFHRQRRFEQGRLARGIRDHLAKIEKTATREMKENEKNKVEMLKTTDLESYSKLLDAKKNERLKFLMETTNKYLDEISALLDNDRNTKNEQDGVVEVHASDTPVDENGEKDYYASAHKKREEIEQPRCIAGGTLKDYQLAGVEWMVSLYNNNLNGVLADEMGLGKTIQTIALLAHMMEVKQNMGPYLVIVPLSTLSNWTNEFNKWFPTCVTITYRGSPQQRKDLYKNFISTKRFNVVLSTYDFVIKDKASLKKTTWEYVIVDEGHRLKNANSKLAQILGNDYVTKRRILLTGTPLQNNLPELWALLNFLLPTIFNSVESFDQWFSSPFDQFKSKIGGPDDNQAENAGLNGEERALIINRLHELLRPFMLRRLKSDVMHSLPEKTEIVLRTPLSSWQVAMYKSITSSALGKKLCGGGLLGNKSVSLNNTLMQLRKVSNHPYLFFKEGWTIDAAMIRCSGKFQLLDRMLIKLKAGGHRVLIFTQMTQVMTIMEDFLSLRGYSCLRLDGSTSAEDRERRMYRFNSPDTPDFVFLLSTRAGGLGLNLATADTVIIFDSDWNPTADAQASDRAHRIGQRQEVRVFRLVSKDTVEEKILAAANAKTEMNSLVVEAGKFDNSETNEEEKKKRQSMMASLLQYGTKEDEEDDDSSQVSQEFDERTAKYTYLNARDIELNDNMATSEEEFQLYCQIDNERKKTKDMIELFTDASDVPNNLQYKEVAAKDVVDELAGGRNKGKETVKYDDGLSETAYVRQMEKQFAAEEKEAKVAKKERKKAEEEKKKQRAKELEEARVQEELQRKLDVAGYKIVELPPELNGGDVAAAAPAAGPGSATKKAGGGKKRKKGDDGVGVGSAVNSDDEDGGGGGNKKSKK